MLRGMYALDQVELGLSTSQIDEKHFDRKPDESSGLSDLVAVVLPPGDGRKVLGADHLRVELAILDSSRTRVLCRL